MALTALLTLVIAALAMLPGILLMRGTAAQPGQVAAAATASLVVMMLITALLGTVVAWMGTGGLPALSLAVLSAAASLIAGWRVRGRPGRIALPEWQAVVFAAVLAAYGLLSLRLGFARTADDTMLVHSWYNADWFKHMGHVHALANYGVPARDIFGNAGPLHYYWLTYLLPGAATAVGGDAWSALAVTNLVITALFCLCFYGLVRELRLAPNMALVAAFVVTLIAAPMVLALELAGGRDFEAVLTNDVPGPALLSLATVIPQHALVVTVLLAWVLLVRPDTAVSRTTQRLGWTALTAVMTISILLGAMVLATYGLLRLWSRNWRALPELALAAVVSGGLVLILRVLEPGNTGAAIDSPLFQNPWPAPWYERAMTAVNRLFGTAGLALPVALVLLRLWRPSAPMELHLRRFAISLLVAAFACGVISCVFLPTRIAMETMIRARLLVGVGVALPLAWVISEAVGPGGKWRWQVGAVAGVLLAFGISAAIVRTAWVADFVPQYTVAVPAADRTVLATLRSRSDPDQTVWQFAEAPWAAVPSGRDMWAPIFAGRPVANSLRATDYAQAAPYISRSDRFFAGEQVEIPAIMEWVYLSRALHPGSYDRVLSRLRADERWSQQACYAAACLFRRRRSVDP